MHFAVIDTDAWIYPTEWSRMEPQWSWLQADLAKVNRTVTPWIVVYGHRALYCGYDSNTECLYETDALRYGRLIGGGSGGQREYVPDRSQGGMGIHGPTHRGPCTAACGRRFGLEQIFLDYGVDVYVAGHTYASQPRAVDRDALSPSSTPLFSHFPPLPAAPSTSAPPHPPLPAAISPSRPRPFPAPPSSEQAPLRARVARPVRAGDRL